MTDSDVQVITPELEEGTLAGGIFYRHWQVSEPRAVVLLVHGLGEHSGRYQHVAEALAAQGIVCLAPDHAGHGRSPGKRCHIGSFNEFSAPLDALRVMIDSRYPELPCFIVGHSMGGLIAGSYLLERQERFAGAAFSGAAFEVPEPPGAGAMLMYRLMALLLPTLGAMQLDPSQISRDPAVVKDYQEDPLVHDGKISASLVVALLTTMNELQTRREEITLPVLVMHGAGDVMTPPAGSQHFHDGVGSDDKTIKIYPELYHEIFNEPERAVVLGDLARWLEGHIGGSAQA